jgi:hypothetical protein
MLGVAASRPQALGMVGPRSPADLRSRDPSVGPVAPLSACLQLELCLQYPVRVERNAFGGLKTTLKQGTQPPIVASTA